ncbi:uncharacterized protein RJT21DRAFT_29313 [Scheffersomyces amazonensis]|uniref:uncharacterized protein n=1 Tax=Scheffersomyces amazonensis TaxID=1078765 RepID=UPI00315D0B6D
MSTRDSTYSYVHLDNPNRVIYMERWRDDHIPFDMIDTQPLLDATSSLLPFEDEEDDGSVSLQPASFGANLYKNRTTKDRTWMDLGITEKIADESGTLTDKTMLGVLHTNDTTTNSHLTLAEFLSNGYQSKAAPPFMVMNSDLANDTSFSVHQGGDFFPNSTSSEFPINNHTFLNTRTGSVGSTVQTPRVGKTRQVSTDRNFQTPITRIMR